MRSICFFGLAMASPSLLLAPGILAQETVAPFTERVHLATFVAEPDSMAAVAPEPPETPLGNADGPNGAG
jgi:hypothetical protein